MKTSLAGYTGIAYIVVSGAISFAANAAEITVMGYRGAFEENYKKAVVEPFQAEHPDIKVNYYGRTECCHCAWQYARAERLASD
jgi:ABC-type glycerol-3-phosphate transport system substrate-binding protein